jgi:hypothetical protein
MKYRNRIGLGIATLFLMFLRILRPLARKALIAAMPGRRMKFSSAKIVSYRRLMGKWQSYIQNNARTYLVHHV